MKNNNIEDKDLEGLLNSAKEDLSVYIETKKELVKLRVYEKLSISSSYVVYGLIVFIFIFTIFFLALIALGAFLGEILNSYSISFGILMLATMLVLFIFVLNAKRIRLSITNMVIKIIKKIESDED